MALKRDWMVAITYPHLRSRIIDAGGASRDNGEPRGTTLLPNSNNYTYYHVLP